MAAGCRAGPASWILGGWQVSGIFTAQSGQPIFFTANAATLRAPGNTQRPNVSGKPKVVGGIGANNQWFDTSVFSFPEPNTFGNVGAQRASRRAGLHQSRRKPRQVVHVQE